VRVSRVFEGVEPIENVVKRLYDDEVAALDIVGLKQAMESTYP
jgi:hypothetical protein